NTLVLRADLWGHPTFAELLRRVRDTSLEALAHQDVPLEKLLEELRPARDFGRTPLFGVTFGVQNAPEPRPRGVSGLRISPLEVESDEARFDLTVWVKERGRGLEVRWTYTLDLFQAPTIHRLQRDFEAILRRVVASPESTPYPPGEQRPVTTEGES